MTKLIAWLEELNRKDTRVRAVLRRSLSFEAGSYPPSYPYIEWSLCNDNDIWRRSVYYLVAGLWAQHWREGREPGLTIGHACAALKISQGDSESIERRFVTLLDADRDQLPHRLRQMIALLKDFPIDFESSLEGLVFWNDGRKRTQNRWARDFYRKLQNRIEVNESCHEENTP